MKVFSTAVWISLLCTVCGADADPWLIAAELKILHVPQPVGISVIPRLLDPATASDALKDLESRPGSESKEIATLNVRAFNDRRERSELQETQSFIDEEIETDLRIGPSVVDGENPPVTGYSGRSMREIALGPFLEITARPIAVGSHILLNHSCGNVEFVDWLQLETATLPSGMKVATRRPITRERSTKGMLVLRNNVPHLLGAYMHSFPQQGFELHLLTARASKASGFPEPKKRTSDLEAMKELDALTIPPAWQAVITLQRFRIQSKDALIARKAFSDRKQAAGALDHLLRQCETGAARLIDFQCATALQANQGESDNDTIHIQPRDDSFAPRLAPEYLDMQSVPYSAQPPCLLMDEKSGSSLAIQIGADQFAAPKPADERFALVRLFTSQSELANYRRWTVGPEMFGAFAHIYRPEYRRRESTVELWMKDKTPVLVGFHQIPDNSTECALSVATALITPIGTNSIPPK